MPNNLFIALTSATSYRPPPPEGFEGGGAGTVPTGQAWTLTAPYFLGTTDYPHIFVGYSAGLNTEYSDNGGGSTPYGSIAVADDQSWLYYMSGYGPNWTLSKWSLEYPGDWSRTTYEGSVPFNFTRSDLNIEMYVDSSQTRLYLLDYSAETIYQYSLSANPLGCTLVASYAIVSPYSGQPRSGAYTLIRPKYQSFSICLSGTKLILWNRQILRYLSYTLSTPYLISSATPDWAGNLPFLSADGLQTGYTTALTTINGVSDNKYKAIQWTADGQNLYLLGDAQYKILQFYCSDPWNLSTATLVGSVSYSSQGSANDMFLNDWVGSPCIVLAHLNKLSLWGFSSGTSISSLYFIRSWQPKYPNATTNITINAITFADVYQYLYILNGSRVIQYEIPGGISTLGLNQYAIGAKTGLVSGVSIQMKSDGRELYIMTNSGRVWRSSLSSSYLISSAVSPTDLTASRTLQRVCDVSGATENTFDLGGFYISPDGDKIFTCDQPTTLSEFNLFTRGMRVYRYNLSSNWNISSFSINSRSGTGYFSPNDTVPVKSKVSESGTRIINIYKSYNPDITRMTIFTMGTAGSLASATYSTTNTTTSYSSYYTANFHFSNSGKLLFGLNNSGYVTRLTIPSVYTINNGWNLTFQPLLRSTTKGPGFLRSISYNTFVRMKPDGTKVFWFRNVGNNPGNSTITETPLATAFDFNSRGTDSSLVIQTASFSSPQTVGGFYIRDDGTKFWIFRPNYRLQEWSMPTPWSIQGATLVKTYAPPFNVGCGLHWTPDGQRLFMGTSDRIVSFYCTTPWDIATAIYEETNRFIAGTGVRDFYMDDSGTKLFICFEGSSPTRTAVIREYNMSNFELGTVTFVRSYQPSNRLFNMVTSATSISVVNSGQYMLMAYRSYRNLNDGSTDVIDCLLYRLV